MQVEADRVRAVPRQWTDLAAPDPEVTIGKGRALLRVPDLMELAALVARLVEAGSPAIARKTNNAAHVNGNTPHRDPEHRRRTHVFRTN